MFPFNCSRCVFILGHDPGGDTRPFAGRGSPAQPLSTSCQPRLRLQATAAHSEPAWEGKATGRLGDSWAQPGPSSASQSFASCASVFCRTEARARPPSLTHQRKMPAVPSLSGPRLRSGRLGQGPPRLGLGGLPREETLVRRDVGGPLGAAHISRPAQGQPGRVTSSNRPPHLSQPPAPVRTVRVSGPISSRLCLNRFSPGSPLLPE